MRSEAPVWLGRCDACGLQAEILLGVILSLARTLPPELACTHSEWALRLCGERIEAVPVVKAIVGIVLLLQTHPMDLRPFGRKWFSL